MKKAITSILKIGDIASVILNKPLSPHCTGSETYLSEIIRNDLTTDIVMGKYVGDRPDLIKINPFDERLLDAPRGLSRYVVIAKNQIKEIYLYDKPKKIFP